MARLDILGKNVDPVVLEKISQMLKTPEGNQLKNRLESIDKDAMMKLFSQMNVSQKDVLEISNKIKGLSQAELMNEILKKMGRG